MGDHLSYDELARAYRALERERDVLLANDQHLRLKMEQLHRKLDVVCGDRIRWYQRFRVEQQTVLTLRKNISQLAKQLHMFTGK